MKRSTYLPLALRILPSAPLAFKKNNYGGDSYGGTLPCPPRIGRRPYEPRYFHAKVAATGWNDRYENEHLPPLALRILPSAPLAF
jgi:hypothetical protein